MSDLDDRLRASLRAIEIDGPPLGIAHQRVLRRATERRTARRFRWIGGALALLALPGSAATVAFAGRGEGRTRVEVVQPDTDTEPDAPAPVPPDADAGLPAAPDADDARKDGTDPLAAPTPIAGAASAASPRSSAATAAPPRAEAGGATAAPAPASPSASTTTAPPAERAAPADEGCEIEGYDDRSVYVPNGGAGAGAPPSCTYEATQRGGYVAAGDTWVIEIQRDGFARTLTGRSGDPACGPLGTIEPGDRVTVTVRDGLERAATPRHVRVGPRWHC